MQTQNYNLIDHLGDDFEQQGLLEKKRRVDAQIEEHTALYGAKRFAAKDEEILINTVHNLLIMQRDYAAKINFIRSIYPN